jgi:hypothetical protein
MTSRSPHGTSLYSPVLPDPAPDLPASLDFFLGRTSVLEPTCTLGVSRVVLSAFCSGTMGLTVLAGAFCFLMNEVSRLIPGRLTK